MTKRLVLTLAFIVVFLLGFTGGHIKTIMELEIETDGNGDSAIVTTLGGQQYLYAINGHELDTWGAKVYDLGKP
jgi:hypothetical protein